MENKIDIWLVSYNHSAYIKKCIESIVAQRCSGGVSLVWVDDASVDDTVRIGEEVLRNVDIPVRRIHHKINRHQKYVPTLIDLMEHSNGEFVALIDGDDFWIDNWKLEKQLKALNAVNSADLCFTRSRECDVAGNLNNTIWGNCGDVAGMVPVGKVIEGDGGFMPTATVFFRRKILESAPSFVWRFQPVGDFMIQVFGALRGGAVYLPDYTSVWRRGHSGSWSVRVHSSPEANIEFHKDFILHILQIRAAINVVYHKNFENLIISHLNALFKICSSVKDFSAMHEVLRDVRFSNSR